MTFVYEPIPEADKKKHNITDNNYFYRVGASSWAVDRERDMFLLPRTGQGPESIPGQINWAFYWRGHLLDVLLGSFPVNWNESMCHVAARKKVLQLNLFSSELEPKRRQILRDLQDALTANRAFGLVPESMSYEVTLEAE